MHRESPLRRALHIAGIAGAIAVIIVVIWLDIATGVWQDLVVLSGLAAGLVTFLLTVLVVDRVVARSNARRWAPVTRLALTEFLHGLADEDQSEIARGVIVPRTLPPLSLELLPTDRAAKLRELRELVVAERQHLSNALSHWVEFLAASSGSNDVLLHVADVALQLDRIREASLDLEREATTATIASLNAEIHTCNERFEALAAELKEQLKAPAPRLR